ncbi:hypothetical protein CMO96_00085 [Candidatus Woesebacteria bacterium]|nr:hypothetical protein [Candidatus Woesebacteria bacterium]
MLKITWEKPEIADEVKDLLKKPSKKKDEPHKFWSHKERTLVGVIFAATILFSIYFWYKGQGKLPEVNVGGFGLNETVVVEK